MTDISIWDDIDYDCHCDDENVCQEPCTQGQDDQIYHEETCKNYHKGIRIGMFEVVRKLLQDGIIQLKDALSCVKFTTEEKAELSDLYFKGVYDYGGNGRETFDLNDFNFKEGYEYGIVDALYTLYDKNIINDRQATQYSS
jgi:hypothetical protein